MMKHKKKHEEEKAPDEIKDKKAEKKDVTLTHDEYTALKDKADKADENHDKFMRSLADIENYRKRVQKDKSDILKFANTDFIKGLFPILDNFDRTVMNITDTSDVLKVKEGIGLIDGQFHKYLESVGLKTITSVGEEFDPHKHEAVMSEETDEYPENVVVEEMQKGYLLNDRLIRPSMVKVAKPLSSSEEAATQDSVKDE
ncbi:MAG: nucleotide exchange factor GrpE [Candidatus Ancaeobacter aquaticus]|nr:nucleotide exchange factor GrpE [Candidatus Ancaeobacter aquaticus]